MFERLLSGYRLTDAFAEQMEASLNKMETRVFGRDQRVRGILRVALPPTVATHLLTAFESGQYIAHDCDTAIAANRQSLICSIGRRRCENFAWTRCSITRRSAIYLYLHATVRQPHDGCCQTVISASSPHPRSRAALRGPAREPGRRSGQPLHLNHLVHRHALARSR